MVYILNRDASARLTISSPLEAHKSHTLVYHIVGLDVGFENPMFACLEMDYEVSIATKPKMNFTLQNSLCNHFLIIYHNFHVNEDFGCTIGFYVLLVNGLLFEYVGTYFNDLYHCRRLIAITLVKQLRWCNRC